MNEREPKRILPVVTQPDIEEVRRNELVSEDFLEEWMRIFDENPHLALEIRSIAHTEAAFSRAGDTTSEEQAVRLIHFASYVVAALRHAGVRERAEHIRQTVEMRFSDTDDTTAAQDSSE